MKKMVQKFIGDAIRDALKSNATPSGILTVSPLNDRLRISTSVDGLRSPVSEVDGHK
jgi:hypothetical protein